MRLRAWELGIFCGGLTESRLPEAGCLFVECLGLRRGGAKPQPINPFTSTNLPRLAVPQSNQLQRVRFVNQGDSLRAPE